MMRNGWIGEVYLKAKRYFTSSAVGQRGVCKCLLPLRHFVANYLTHSYAVVLSFMVAVLQEVVAVCRVVAIVATKVMVACLAAGLLNVCYVFVDNLLPIFLQLLNVDCGFPLWHVATYSYVE
ncbi:PREDICTED: uncharacterized protein LOC108362590 isoform X1 [Rhagoletis zephyria]|uniref:uncharacterized protein LOC108362590 isoform X1 n=1 Tax=Rhagoletis zephyria TaxID=28612 RepID=UPI0008119EAF|nr:PREDICTED: uncharacterized protein LOC108362590 isoform X1 [Rhagoletis zephyria]